MTLAKINHEQSLYVLHAGHGFSCLGFDHAERRRRGVLEWIGVPVADMEPGTAEHFAAYQDAMRAGAEYAKATGKRCGIHLTPELVGKEGMRVEVSGDAEGKRRFWVGKSTGWMPCHLEISRRGSTGGPSVYIGEGATVRVVRCA